MASFGVTLCKKLTHCLICSNPINVAIVPWLNGLPELLTQLGYNSPNTSSLILEVLVHAAASKLLPSLAKQTEELFG